MRNVLIIIGIIIFSINISSATNIIKGKVYQNHINEVFGTRMTVSLPPGKWEAVKITTRKQYTNVEFKNIKDEADLEIWLPNQILFGGFSKRLKKCNGDSKSTLHAAGISRSGFHTSYCIKSDKNWLVISLEGMSIHVGNGSFYGSYFLYYPVKKSIAASLTKDKLEDIGVSLMRSFKKNYEGRPSDYSAVKMLLSSNNNLDNSTSSTSKYIPPPKSMSSLSDKEVCLRATTKNGLGWENVNSNFGDYVKEAFNRKLSLYECRKLTDRFPKTASEESSLIDKLRELKSMFYEGLISQEEYDAKSTKLLEEF